MKLASNAIAYFERVLEAPLEHFDQTMRVNVRGMYLATITAAKHMAARRRRDRVHGVDCIDRGRGAAGDLQRLEGRGGAAGPLPRRRPRAPRDSGQRGRARLGADAADGEVVTDPAQWSKHRSRIPLDRPAEPHEIAAVVRFLLSDEARTSPGRS